MPNKSLLKDLFISGLSFFNEPEVLQTQNHCAQDISPEKIHRHKRGLNSRTSSLEVNMYPTTIEEHFILNK